MEQYTDEYWQAKIGKVSASSIADVMAKGKGSKEAVTRRNYRVSLVKERLKGSRDETYQNAHMERGLKREPEARQAYCFYKNTEVQEVGFIDHPTIPMSGASPDGLVGDDGLIEIKNPTDGIHIEYIINNEIPRDYKLQMTWQMECTGRKWCDWISFDPEWPHGLQIIIIRYHYDPVLAKEIREEVIQFLEETEMLERVLRKRMIA